MRICALVGFYQDRKAGQRLLSNLESHGIPSLWADSRLDGFPQYNNSDLSTDGLPELIERSPDARLYSLGLTKPGEVMNFLLKEASRLKFDYTITLGCDEWLEGDFELFKSNLEMIPKFEPKKLRLPLVEHNFGGTNWGGHITERIVYMPQYVFLKGVHYVYFHNFFDYDKPMKITPLVLGFELHHDDRIRDPERNKKMDEFQEIQKKDELETLIKMAKNNEF